MLSASPQDADLANQRRQQNESLASELSHLGIVARVVVALLLLSVAALVALAGFVLGTVGHWFPYLITLAIVEPLVLFLLVGGLFCLFPVSALGRAFCFVLGRAYRVIMFLLVCSALSTVVGLALAALTYFRSS